MSFFYLFKDIIQNLDILFVSKKILLIELIEIHRVIL